MEGRRSRPFNLLYIYPFQEGHMLVEYFALKIQAKINKRKFQCRIIAVVLFPSLYYLYIYTYIYMYIYIYIYISYHFSGAHPSALPPERPNVCLITTEWFLRGAGDQECTPPSSYIFKSFLQFLYTFFVFFDMKLLH